MTKRLFVGGLPYSLTEAELREMFSEVGEVSSCSLIIDKFSGQSKGFAFVEMKDDKDADKAIEILNGKEVKGRNIAVNIAKPREDRPDRRFGGGNGGSRDFGRGGDRNFDRRGGDRNNFRRSH